MNRRPVPRVARAGLAVLALPFAIAFVPLWVAAAPAGAQVDPEVAVREFSFSPGALSVGAGSVVRFTNGGRRPHTVTDRGGTFDTGPIFPGSSKEQVFDTPGTYSFFCKINPEQMNATLVVEPGPAATKAVRVQTVDGTRDPSESLRFDPPTLAVELGTSIVVANVGGLRHSLALDDGSLATPVLEPGAGGRFPGTNATIVARKEGTFGFRCSVHPDRMRGVLRVGAAPPAVSTTIAESTRPPPTAVPIPEDASAAPLAVTDAGKDEGVSIAGIAAGLAAVAAVVVVIPYLMRRRTRP